LLPSYQATNSLLAASPYLIATPSILGRGSPAGRVRGANGVVNHHKGEYVRDGAHVNTSESFHALLKRGVHGTYHHWSVKHLHRYLSEFDFRFNLRKVADGERTLEALKGFEGKRLMYKDSTKKG